MQSGQLNLLPDWPKERESIGGIERFGLCPSGGCVSLSNLAVGGIFFVGCGWVEVEVTEGGLRFKWRVMEGTYTLVEVDSPWYR